MDCQNAAFWDASTQAPMDCQNAALWDASLQRRVRLAGPGAGSSMYLKFCLSGCYNAGPRVTGWPRSCLPVDFQSAAFWDAAMQGYM
eukprot:1161102-Pelagomonas_calceolata.AAC.7